MKAPFSLKITKHNNVIVNEAKVQYFRKERNKVSAKGGSTFLVYLINNDKNKEKMYHGIAICSIKDNFSRKFGKRLAELRIINSIRKINNYNIIQPDKLVEIIETENDINICKNKISLCKNNIKISNINNKNTQDNQNNLELEIQNYEKKLNLLFNNEE